MRILITAGPTREPIDAVRFISNRSSGAMGLALARAAQEAGHEVTLLLGPIGHSQSDVSQSAITTYPFESSAELKQLLEAHFSDHDVLIMAAAVCDYRPAAVVDGKMSSDKDAGLLLELQPTPDLVKLMAERKRAHQRVVAFALEDPGQLEVRAVEKMKRKGVDAIVANPLETMDSDRVRAILFTAHGGRFAAGHMTKSDFAHWLIAQLNTIQNPA